MRASIMTLLLAVAACGGPSVGSEQDVPRPVERAATSGPDWVVIEGIEFPAAMAEAPEDVIEAYVFAAKHQDVLEYMPCYCGCENPRFAHMNNYDCFIDSIDRSREVPRVDPDPMGFG